MRITAEYYINILGPLYPFLLQKNRFPRLSSSTLNSWSNWAQRL